MTPNRWLAVAALAVAAIVAGSLALGTLGKQEREFAADTPEGAVQRYLRAVEEEDATTIRSLMAPGVTERCELSDIRNALRYPDNRDLRVTLRSSKVTGDRAEVRVGVSEVSGGPFDGGSYDHDETYDLVRSGSGWLFSEPGWPIYCPSKFVPAVPVTPASTATPTPSSTTPAGSR